MPNAQPQSTFRRFAGVVGRLAMRHTGHTGFRIAQHLYGRERAIQLLRESYGPAFARYGRAATAPAPTRRRSLAGVTIGGVPANEFTIPERPAPDGGYASSGTSRARARYGLGAAAPRAPADPMRILRQTADAWADYETTDPDLTVELTPASPTASVQLPPGAHHVMADGHTFGSAVAHIPEVLRAPAPTPRLGSLMAGMRDGSWGYVPPVAPEAQPAIRMGDVQRRRPAAAATIDALDGGLVGFTPKRSGLAH